MGARSSRTGLRGAVVVCVVAAGLGSSPAAPAASFPTISLSTGITPKFAQSVNDYVTGCAGGSTEVSVNRTAATAVKVEMKATRAGRSTSSVTLSAGQRFTVTVGSGRSARQYSIRCLPDDFPRFSSVGTLPGSAPYVGLTAFGSNERAPYAFIVNALGIPVWWKRVDADHAFDLKPVPGGKVGFWGSNFIDDGSAGPFSVHDLSGNLVRNVTANGVGNDLHETLPEVNGNFLRIVRVPHPHIDLSAWNGPDDHVIWSDRIEEIDSDGHVSWSWDTFDHVAQSEGGRWTGLLTFIAGANPLDVDHVNSISEDSSGGLVISMRHRDAVYRIDRATGEITWKLGGTPMAKSLSVIGDSEHPGEPFAAQHDARVLPDGTLSVYDNGSGIQGRAPRVTRWRIDSGARTATLIESFGDSKVRSSTAGGSARRLDDGSWVVSWSSQPMVAGYDANHVRRFELRFSPLRVAYRAAPFGREYTRSMFIAGMDAQYPR